MKSTSPFSRSATIAARSPARSIAGPEVVRTLTRSSRAIMCASEVLPSPGGPENSTWSRTSPRFLAASIDMPRIALEALLADEFREAVRAQRQVNRHLLEADFRRSQWLRRRFRRDDLTLAMRLTFRQAAPPTIFELWFPSLPTRFQPSPNQLHAAPGLVCTPDSPARKPRRPRLSPPHSAMPPEQP